MAVGDARGRWARAGFARLLERLEALLCSGALVARVGRGRLAGALEVAEAREAVLGHASPVRLRGDAGRVRVRAQSRTRSISSAMVIESGFVSPTAFARWRWMSSVFSAKAS